MTGHHCLHCSDCQETNKVGNFVCHAVAQTVEKQLEAFSLNEPVWVKFEKTEHLATFQGFSCDETSGDGQSSTSCITVKFQSDDSFLEVPIDCVQKFSSRGLTRSSKGQTNQNSNLGSMLRATIKVTSAGPFTDDQKAVTFKATEVDFDKCKTALLWLKENNHLHSDIVVDEAFAQPIVIDHSEEDVTTNSNMENTIVTKTIFPDHQNTNINNGGFETAEQFKMKTMENMTMADSKLIARPTVDLIQDCKDDALLKAFVLQFPHGIGV